MIERRRLGLSLGFGAVPGRQVGVEEREVVFMALVPPRRPLGLSGTHQRGDLLVGEPVSSGQGLAILARVA
jgi:hypothetical protein